MSEHQYHVYEYPMDDGGVSRVRPYLDTYQDNGNLYVGLEFYMEDGFWEPDLSITVNTIPLAYLEAAIDTNNNGNKILEFLQKNNFGELTPFTVSSGFCVYPIFRFNEEKIMEIDPEVFREYAKTFGVDKPHLDAQIAHADMKAGTQTQHQEKEQER